MMVQRLNAPFCAYAIMGNNIRANTALIPSDTCKTALDRTIRTGITIHSVFPYTFDITARLCGEAAGVVMDAKPWYYLDESSCGGRGSNVRLSCVPNRTRPTLPRKSRNPGGQQG